MATTGLRGHAAAAAAVLLVPLLLLGLRDVLRLVHHAQTLELETAEAARAHADAAAQLEDVRAAHAAALVQVFGALGAHGHRDLVASTATLVAELHRDGFASAASPPVRDWPSRAGQVRSRRRPTARMSSSGLQDVERTSVTVSVEAPLERVPAAVDAALRAEAGLTSVSVTKSATGAGQVGLRISAVTVDRPALEQSLRASAAVPLRAVVEPPVSSLSPRTLLPEAVARAILGAGHQDLARKAARDRTRVSDARRLAEALRGLERDFASTAKVLADARPAREPSMAGAGGRCWLDLLGTGQAQVVTWDASSVVVLVQPAGRASAIACFGRARAPTNTLASGAVELTWRLPAPPPRQASSPP